jgi:hypothetical protein
MKKTRSKKSRDTVPLKVLIKYKLLVQGNLREVKVSVKTAIISDYGTLPMSSRTPTEQGVGLLIKRNVSQDFLEYIFARNHLPSVSGS